jgi:pilus assembly protein CpaC
VRVKIGIPVTCFCLQLFMSCSDSALQAQTRAAIPQAAPATNQDQANDLFVGVGKSVLVDSARPVERIAVASSDLAEATAVSPSEIMINGKAPGETTLIVWQAGGGRQFFNLKVRPSEAAATDRLDALRRELRTEFPGQQFRVSSEGGTIFLRGTVRDLESSDRAVQIASTAGKVVNLLYVNVPPSETQILLKVRFASLDRSLANQLGINIFSTGAANTIGSITTQQFSPPTLSVPSGGSSSSASLSSLLNIFMFRPDLNLGATIQALETKGVLQVLAEPNVLTSNGKQGSFLAGGQFPYPVVQGTTGGGGTGAVTIQFKEFGVRLDFIPTLTPRGTIRLQVSPEVSALDFANGVTISGFTVPGVSTRRVKTEVELGEGQSFAIGGLLDERENKTFEKIPFIGDVPILGRLFQSISKTRNNTELIVIVTPEIVSPMPVGAPLPELKYPDPFQPFLSGIPMTTPQTNAPDKQAVVPPSAIPVEKLVKSMQPEQPLVTNSLSPGTVYSSPTSSASTPQPPPQ